MAEARYLKVMLYPVRSRSLKPDRVANAVCGAREVLRRICSPSETPRLPLALRREAQALLRFFLVHAELHPIVTTAFMLKDEPMPKVFPVWPEHEFD